MPSKKKKYNARFPAGRIKKIMQTDEEIGKVAQAVPVIISRTLELFVESLLKRAMQITSAKNAKTLTPTHMKQCILSESRFDFLKDLVKGIPDVSSTDDEFGTSSGNMSPGTPLSAKAYGGYSCFQFHQSSDKDSTKSSNSTIYNPVAQTSQPKFYKEIPIGGENCENKICENITPSFFCGTTIIQHTNSQLSNHCSSFPPPSKDEGNPSLIRTISGRNVTQLNELKLSSCNKANECGSVGTEKQERNGEEEEEEEEDDEDEDENGDVEEEVPELGENGYHKEGNRAKTYIIDEDYDT